jgi:predicted anti-sigma-YlaC factor YlaD
MSDFSRQEPTCQELAEFVTDYIEGVLPPAQRVNFDLHIADCPDCRNYVEQMRVTIAVAGRVPAEEIPPAVRGGLLAAFRDWAAGGP